jgi:outer membrane protein TolC
MVVSNRILSRLVCALACLGVAFPTHAQGILATVFPEQRCMEIRSPEQISAVPLPDVATPPTVAKPAADREPFQLSLDESIRIALRNSEVVRVLTGTGAASSGSTMYDPAVTNTQIDQARARFDPNLQLQNDFDRVETPQAGFDPADPTRAVIEGDRIDQYNMGLGLSKTTASGGTAALGVTANSLRSSAQGLPLNPQGTSSVDLSFTQPLLQGGGIRANLAPIEIARIDTERSFYQLKASVQRLVAGVIQAYWALVFARVDVWARQQQVKQGQWAFELADARLRHQLGNAGDVAQARSSLAGFRANLITSQANVLQREAALRNILGLPPSDNRQIIPVTPPAMDWIDVEWETILANAGEYRPDLIELKLALEADRQELLVANNQAFPRVDASALYRWDSLGGRGPDGQHVFSEPGQFTGWQLGLDVSVPLGLRQARAALRQQELTLMRDRANLEQALHNASHLLAENYRDLTQYYQQYQAFKETRSAARMNLDAQSARWIADLTIYLNVLQAITSWGDAVDSEAQSLLQYNTESANLQEQMGTILEVHGVRFVEEPYCSIGPAGRLGRGRWYPKGSRAGPYENQYPTGKEPSENAFDLSEPVLPRRSDLERRRRPVEMPELEPGNAAQPLPGDLMRPLRNLKRGPSS